MRASAVMYEEEGAALHSKLCNVVACTLWRRTRNVGTVRTTLNLSP